jgi:hypothetical protein
MSRTVPLTRPALVAVALALPLALGAGCGSADPEGGGAASGSGAMVIELVEPVPAMGGADAVPGNTSLTGRFYDGPVPSPIGWKKLADEGGCQLYEPKPPFCDPLCKVGSTCVADGKCEVNPEAQSAGTVKVKGLKSTAGAAEVSMPPSPPGYFYAPKVDEKFPFPAFAEGAAIEVSSSGDKIPAFSVTGKGIKPLELQATGDIPFEKGKATPLKWAAPGMPELSRVLITVDISHHGGSKGKIECDVADTGMQTIPASLVTRLIELGVSGFPVVNLARRAITGVSIAQGRVELRIVSEIEHHLAIPGLNSCTQDSECPGGKTCLPDLSCEK